MALWLVFGCAPVQARPRAVLFLCSAPSLQDIQDADAPHLQSLMREGGVGVMTVGLSNTDRLRTMTNDGYVPVITRSGAKIAPGDLVRALRGNGGLAYVGSRHDARMAGGGRIHMPNDLFQGEIPRPDVEVFTASIRDAAGESGVLIVSTRPDPEPELARDAFLKLIAAQDRVLGTVRKILPETTVIATCPDPIMPDNLRGSPDSRRKKP